MNSSTSFLRNQTVPSKRQAFPARQRPVCQIAPVTVLCIMKSTSTSNSPPKPKIHSVNNKLLGGAQRNAAGAPLLLPRLELARHRCLYNIYICFKWCTTRARPILSFSLPRPSPLASTSSDSLFFSFTTIFGISSINSLFYARVWSTRLLSRSSPAPRVPSPLEFGFQLNFHLA